MLKLVANILENLHLFKATLMHVWRTAVRETGIYWHHRGPIKGPETSRKSWQIFIKRIYFSSTQNYIIYPNWKKLHPLPKSLASLERLLKGLPKTPQHDSAVSCTRDFRGPQFQPPPERRQSPRQLYVCSQTGHM